MTVRVLGAVHMVDASGEVAAAELLDAAIVRLEAARDLNAVIADLFDRAREQAVTLDTSGPAWCATSVS